jgi:hypothetical protein
MKYSVKGNICLQVHGYLCSQSWETRIAAGQAVEAICRNVPKFEPKIPVKQGQFLLKINIHIYHNTKIIIL